ncbi:hypothetical protein CcI49_24405 [Frankia sp. CcI49]|nr:hypothetical protein CcI49_24405 [Frankia sp. CcI49]
MAGRRAPAAAGDRRRRQGAAGGGRALPAEWPPAERPPVTAGGRLVTVGRIAAMNPRRERRGRARRPSNSAGPVAAEGARTGGEWVASCADEP